jgi:hypothetical protein
MIYLEKLQTRAMGQNVRPPQPIRPMANVIPNMNNRVNINANPSSMLTPQQQMLLTAQMNPQLLQQYLTMQQNAGKPGFVGTNQNVPIIQKNSMNLAISQQTVRPPAQPAHTITTNMIQALTTRLQSLFKDSQQDPVIQQKIKELCKQKGVSLNAVSQSPQDEATVNETV